MTILIKNPAIVNEGKIFSGDVLIVNDRIEKVSSSISTPQNATVIDASGKYLFPGVIDDQVHFREPGLTHKAEIYTEAKAAVAGGITSYMEMPNTVPNALTQELLEEKYRIAEKKSLANFSFFMGASNENIEEVRKTDPKMVCGVKVFMGSSTGNMLVDNEKTLEAIFSSSPTLIAVHAEDETTIRTNLAAYKEKYGDDIPIGCHPLIRSEDACYLSSSLAVRLAKKHHSRLHVLHISTAKELELFDNTLPVEKKMITAEACIHHLWFDDRDYARLGNLIKWNPAVKTEKDKNAILQGVLDNHIDIIATDHAPHTLEEKQKKYAQASSGGPLIQHSLITMLELFHQKKISLEKIAEKMCHSPALCYKVKERGYIREGCFADLVLVDINSPWTVEKTNLLYKCGWSPLEGQTFHSKVTHTFVNGRLVYENTNGMRFDEEVKGKRLVFER